MLRDVFSRSFETIWACFDMALDFLTEWNFHGVPLLYYLIGLALVSIMLSYIFGSN